VSELNENIHKILSFTVFQAALINSTKLIFGDVELYSKHYHPAD